jgi:L-cystine transport system permease protein
MDFDFSFFLVAMRGSIQAIPVTLIIAIAPILLGAILGLPIALIRFFEIKILSPIFKWAVTLLRGIPIVLILLVLYLVTATSYDNIMKALHLPFEFKDFNKAVVAIVALTLAATAALSEVFRGSLAGVKKGQFDAAHSIGLTWFQVLSRIIIPQAIPISLPMICNVLIGLLKAAALASMVSVVDVLNGSLITANANYKYLEAYIAAACVYWAISLCIERIFLLVEKISGQKLREVKA